MNMRRKGGVGYLAGGLLIVLFLLGPGGSMLALGQGVDIDRLVLPEGRPYKPSRIIVMAEIEIHEIGFDLLSYLRTSEFAYYDNLIEDLGDLEMCLTGYEKAVTGPEDRQNIAQVKQIYGELKPLVSEIIGLNADYTHLRRRFEQTVNKLDDFIDEKIELDLFCRDYDPELKEWALARRGIECENQQFAWRLTWFLETGSEKDKEMAANNFKQLEYFVAELKKVAGSYWEKKLAYATEVIVLELKKISADLVTKGDKLHQKIQLFKGKIDAMDRIIDENIQKDIHR